MRMPQAGGSTPTRYCFCVYSVLPWFPLLTRFEASRSLVERADACIHFSVWGCKPLSEEGVCIIKDLVLSALIDFG